MGFAMRMQHVPATTPEHAKAGIMRSWAAGTANAVLQVVLLRPHALKLSGQCRDSLIPLWSESERRAFITALWAQGPGHVPIETTIAPLKGVCLNKSGDESERTGRIQQNQPTQSCKPLGYAVHYRHGLQGKTC
jgi:hypothetical protein